MIDQKSWRQLYQISAIPSEENITYVEFKSIIRKRRGLTSRIERENSDGPKIAVALLKIDAEHWAVTTRTYKAFNLQELFILAITYHLTCMFLNTSSNTTAFRCSIAQASLA